MDMNYNKNILILKDKFMITVRQISKKRDFKKFVKFPTWLYKDNKNYIPPFEQDELDLTNPKKNACFEEI